MTIARWRRATMRALAACVACAPPALRAQDMGAPPPIPPPGRLVDIGGWKLHLVCTGQASAQPTVILEAGVGDFSVEWSLVQPRVAAFARVCSYDRADDGWSDYGPHPRTMHQMVSELHTLLERSGERGPLLLVGHSFGGVLVRLYTSLYPNDVAGVVLVESGVENPYRMMGDGRLVRFAETATGRPVPPVKTSGPLRESAIPPGALEQMREGARQLAPTANEPPRDRLPADAQRMRTWALWQVKHYAATDNPFENEELAAMLAVRKANPQPLGDLPLAVLTSRRPVNAADSAYEADRQLQQAALATLSRRGRQVTTTRSGHHIQIEEPELVTDAIRSVLTAANR